MSNDENSHAREDSGSFRSHQGSSALNFQKTTAPTAHDYYMGLVQKSVEEGRPIDEYISLLISDIEMPQMDGLHLLLKIRAKDTFAKTPIIIFSSMATEDNIKKWQHLNANEYISKPEMPYLFSQVDKYVIADT